MNNMLMQHAGINPAVLDLELREVVGDAIYGISSRGSEVIVHFVQDKPDTTVIEAVRQVVAKHDSNKVVPSFKPSLEEEIARLKNELATLEVRMKGNSK
jgi:23S rRNA maturation mini-RNase III